MKSDLVPLLSGEVLEDEVELTLADLCRSCQLRAEQLFELVDEGIIEPVGREPGRWRFGGASLRRVRVAVTLQRDLGVNCAGAALVLDLLEELEALRTRLHAVGEQNWSAPRPRD
nr:MerR family transcriptional regulator [Gammaproteobacteria bacterium]